MWSVCVDCTEVERGAAEEGGGEVWEEKVGKKSRSKKGEEAGL